MLTVPGERSMSPVKYPHVTVQLSGNDGNAYAVLAAIKRAMRHADPPVPQAEIDAFRTEAMSGDYDHLLATAMKYVDVE